MNKLILNLTIVVIAGLSYSALGQLAPRVPAVDISAPNRALDIKADDVCVIDFRNIRMFGENGSWSAHLKNGKFKRESGPKYESVSLDNIFCIKHQDGQHALVMTNWLDCGGSCTSIGVVQLFELRASQPVITQQFVFDSHAEGTHATFDEKSLTLTITGRSDDGSPNCCAQNFDVVTYQWQGSEFKQANYLRIPAPESSYLVELQYDKHDLPYGASSTCLIVFRDGRFQMGQVSIWPNSGTPKFFEDSLSDESLRALRSILEAPELKELRTPDTPLGFAVRQGETLSARIPRGHAKQSFLFAAVEAPAGPAPKVLPIPVDPLVQWIQATRKAINQRKLPPLKNVKSSGGCWPDKQ